MTDEAFPAAGMGLDLGPPRSDGDSAPVDIKSSRDGRAALIQVSGEIDLSNADMLRDAVDAATVAGGCDRLVIDLSGVTFIDSSGLHALVEAADRPTAVLLRAPSRTVRRVIELAGLGGVLPIEREIVG